MRFLPVLALLGAVGSAQADPNDSRHLWGPSGRPLGRGEGHLGTRLLVFGDFSYGLTDHLSLSVGSSVPLPLLTYASVQVGAEPWKWSAASAGVFVGRRQEWEGPTHTVTLPFVAVGLGPRRATLSAAAGLFVDSGAGTTPVAMLGGQVTVTEGLTLVAEAWLHGDARRPEVAVSAAAIRLSDRRWTVDLGFFGRVRGIDRSPVPMLAVGYRFGPE